MAGGEWSYAELCGVPGFGDPADEEITAGVGRWLESSAMESLGTHGPAEFARWSLGRRKASELSIPSAGLIGADGGPEVVAAPFPAVKVKIGSGEMKADRHRIEYLLQAVPVGCRIRLDANRSLSMEALIDWIAWMEGQPGVEYLEQPLEVGREAELMRELGTNAARVGLDESVCAPADLAKMLEMGWPGIFVVKPMLLGNVGMLLRQPETVRCRVRLSSVFETGIGFGKLLDLAQSLDSGDVVHGLGTRGFFADREWDGWNLSPRYTGRLTPDFYGGIWNRALAAAI